MQPLSPTAPPTQPAQTRLLPQPPETADARAAGPSVQTLREAFCGPEHCRQVLEVMAAETQANLDGLRIRGNPRPFYIGNLLRHERGCKVRATYGSIFTSNEWEKAEILADIRVGSYRLDQVLDGGLDDDFEERTSSSWAEAPVDLEPHGLRYALWKLMQVKYEEALQSYYDKRKVMVEEFFRHKVDSFSREPRLELVEPMAAQRFARALWEERTRRISRLFERHEFIFDPQVTFWAGSSSRFFASSEGSRFTSADHYYQLSIQAWVRTRDGVYLPGTLDWYGRQERDLPEMDAVEQSV
ncbi:MAG: hypothetical protein FJ125_07700, partial [Deltaproteobacteria bacterium]|nr:hypothetical protein [Deltaproteobacteria bacterium]